MDVDHVPELVGNGVRLRELRDSEHPAASVVGAQPRNRPRPSRRACTVEPAPTEPAPPSSTISFGGVTYSVPHPLADETVWVRVDGERVVVTHCASSGPIEVARHQRSTPGHPMIDDAHYPARPAGPLGRRPKPPSAAETEFLAIGDGARTLWVPETRPWSLTCGDAGRC